MDLIGAMYNLKEQALRKSKIEDSLINVTKMINTHLIKCFIFQNSTGDLNHWCSEVSAFLPYIPRLKGTNKYPSSKFILKNTIECYIEDLKTIIDTTYDNLIFDGYKEKEYNKDKVYDKICEYYNWMANELSTTGDLSKRKVYNKIKELINE